MMFRLKQSPRRVRAQAVAALGQWLDSIDIDPNSPCRGGTAVGTLFGRLMVEHGNTAVTIQDDKTLLVGSSSIAPSEARAYIWGVTEEIVTIPDEEPEELEEPEEVEEAEDELEEEEEEERVDEPEGEDDEVEDDE